MSLNVAIKIPNSNQFRLAFSRAPYIVRPHMDIAIRKTILKIQGTSQTYTPVDTGRLRASHYTKFSTFYGEVGTSVNYDVYVHEGTRYMQARPFLKDAVEVEEQNIDIYFTEELQKALNKIAKMT